VKAITELFIPSINECQWLRGQVSMTVRATPSNEIRAADYHQHSSTDLTWELRLTQPPPPPGPASTPSLTSVERRHLSTVSAHLQKTTFISWPSLTN